MDAGTIPTLTKSHSFTADVQREILKTRFSRCMLYRYNAEIGTD